MRDSGYFLEIIHTGMVNAGLNVNAIYERLGYNAEDLPLREMRTPHQLQAYFWETVEAVTGDPEIGRSEEHTSELQSLMRISYAVFCLKKKTKATHNTLIT